MDIFEMFDVELQYPITVCSIDSGLGCFTLECHILLL